MAVCRDVIGCDGSRQIATKKGRLHRHRRGRPHGIAQEGRSNSRCVLVPYAGVNRIRFKGCSLSPEHEVMPSRDAPVYVHMWLSVPCIKYDVSL